MEWILEINISPKLADLNEGIEWIDKLVYHSSPEKITITDLSFIYENYDPKDNDDSFENQEIQEKFKQVIQLIEDQIIKDFKAFQERIRPFYKNYHQKNIDEISDILGKIDYVKDQYPSKMEYIRLLAMTNYNGEFDIAEFIQVVKIFKEILYSEP